MTTSYLLTQMQKIARDRDGLCISNEYLNMHTKLSWQCKKGHIWDAEPNSVKRGSWCPYCAGRARLTIEEMRRIAAKKRGRCLSTAYANSETPLLWQCNAEHTWRTKPSHVKSGHWCPRCAKNVRLTIKELQATAAEHGGKCLSRNYVNSQTKTKWQCNDGHAWEATPNSIRSGHWCPYCAGYVPLGIEEMKRLAVSRSGICLSAEYKNNHSKLLWQCRERHCWQTDATSIKSGRWCPYCRASIGEEFSRALFEKLFGATFPRSRPKWLKSPRGKVLELDGYNDNLGVAFEYQGAQHYKDSHYYWGRGGFTKRKTYDAIKRRLCRQSRVSLIEIPFWVRLDRLHDYIVRQCRKRGFAIHPIATTELNAITILSRSKIQEMREVARRRGGDLLSPTYLGSGVPLLWRCKNGHEWKAVPTAVKSRTWCPYCAGRGPVTLSEIRLIALERGGKCLSRKYLGTHTKLRWRCREGHEWMAEPNSIKSGTWCRTCSMRTAQNKRRLTLDEMQGIASMRDGKCLSNEYGGIHIKLSWQCKNGHTWDAEPNSVKRGTWCPRCKNRSLGSGAGVSLLNAKMSASV